MQDGEVSGLIEFHFADVVERFRQTLQRECAYALQYALSEARRQSLPHWVRHYNERSTQNALGNRPV